VLLGAALCAGPLSALRAGSTPRPPGPYRYPTPAGRAGTIGKRLEKAGIDNTAENRRAYRELFYTAPGIGKAFSGVIMFKARPLIALSVLSHGIRIRIRIYIPCGVSR
jgi:hypothetical protein